MCVSYYFIFSAWMNENFRKEFKQVLPFFKESAEGNSSRNRGRFVSNRTNCNGAETVQETLLPTTSHAAGINGNNLTHASAQPGATNPTAVSLLETIDEVNSTTQTAGHVSIDLNKSTASYTAAGEVNEVVVHYPSPSFSSTTPSGGPACTMMDNNNENINNNNNNNQSDTAAPVSTTGGATGTSSTPPEVAKSNEIVIDVEPDRQPRTAPGNLVVIPNQSGNVHASSSSVSTTTQPVTVTADTGTTSRPSGAETLTTASGPTPVSASVEASSSANPINSMKFPPVNPTVLI